MDVALLNPGRFLKSQELRGDTTFTITHIETEELEDTEGDTQVKGLLHLKETNKLWVINVTNALCCKAMFGRETDAWKGKRVTLYAAPWTDQTTKEATTCIRVRGSPDLAADVPFVLKLARKKPQHLVMRKTVPGARVETPAERLLRVAKEKFGQDRAAIRALLERLSPGRVKVMADVTAELADQALAELAKPVAPEREPGGEG